MEKIKVKICQGTTCFVMGGDTIKAMADALLKNMAIKLRLCR